MIFIEMEKLNGICKNISFILKMQIVNVRIMHYTFKLSQLLFNSRAIILISVHKFALYPDYLSTHIHYSNTDEKTIV